MRRPSAPTPSSTAVRMTAVTSRLPFTLRAYRRLDLPAKAAVVLILRTMAGPEPAPDAVPPKQLARPRRSG